MEAEDTQKSSRFRGLFFILGIFTVFIQAGLYAGRNQSLSPVQKVQQVTPGSTISEHPIPKLMADAEDRFRSMLKRQSRTLGEAVREYKRRYGHDPPKGFDDWFKLAMERNVLIIDDYDAIHEDLLPFMSLSGAELRRRVDQV